MSVLSLAKVKLTILTRKIGSQATNNNKIVKNTKIGKS